MHAELIERAERIRHDFERAWSFDTRDLERPSVEHTLRELITRHGGDREKRLEEEFFGLGPLGSLIDDPSVPEILVNGTREIWFEREGRFQRLADGFTSESSLKSFVDRLGAEAGFKVDLAEPFADGRWRGFRVHVGCAPLTHCSLHLSLRRVPENPWTLESLRAGGWASAEQERVLRRLIDERKNLLFVGPTGCGKTSVLGACLKTLPEYERAVILEDTDELPRPNAASTKLLTRPPGQGTLPAVDLAMLVRQSLRMRPQRVIMGEVRGGEAKDLLLALATGHSGSLGTLHASDARQALLRLEMLVQLGAPQWSVLAIRQLIQLSVDALVVCGFAGGHRRLLGISQMAALESFGFLLEPLA